MELAIEKDPVRLLSAVVFLETSMVVETRYGEEGGRELDLLIYKAAVEIVAATADQIEWARLGFRLYGKARHPAGLNFGDCFSSALAHSTGEPLLFKGEDFSRTDVRTVQVPS